MTTNPKERKQHPVATGVIDYFPDALVAVSNVSFVGNEQHNPGLSLRWDRSKSTDESDALMRHFIERGKFDTDGLRHSAKMAWRALALLQKEIEAARAEKEPITAATTTVPATTERCFQNYPGDSLFTCSLEKGHDGRHRAHWGHLLDRKIVAEWPTLPSSGGTCESAPPPEAQTPPQHRCCR